MLNTEERIRLGGLIYARWRAGESATKVGESYGLSETTTRYCVDLYRSDMGIETDQVINRKIVVESGRANMACMDSRSRKDKRVGNPPLHRSALAAAPEREIDPADLSIPVEEAFALRTHKKRNLCSRDPKPFGFV